MKVLNLKDAIYIIDLKKKFSVSLVSASRKKYRDVLAWCKMFFFFGSNQGERNGGEKGLPWGSSVQWRERNEFSRQRPGPTLKRIGKADR